MNLESVIKSSYNAVKSYAVNTGTRTSFYVPMMIPFEFLVGMTPDQVQQSRADAVVVNLGLGWIHGQTRRLTKKILKVTDENPEKKKRADKLAGFTVSALAYAPILYNAGALTWQAAILIPTALTLSTLFGRKYGQFQDWSRKKMNLEPVYRD
jgi:hypothetical protein